MDNSQKMKKNINSADSQSMQKPYPYTNDMDQSFFKYLDDIKKFDIPSNADKDELIWKIDAALNKFREIIFTFAPTINSFLQTLEMLSVKPVCDDIFMPSSVQQLKNYPDSEFFTQWHKSLSKHFKALQQDYTSEKADKIRTVLVCKCSLLKINFDHLEQYYNRLCDYLNVWQDKDCSQNSAKQSVKSLTGEQITFLAEKFLLPPGALTANLHLLFEIRKELTVLKHEILKNHLRLVINIAQKFRNRGVSFNDIVQEGNLGLMRAVDKFDPNLGHKFSTYAVWWIKQNILHCVASQSRTIRIPAHMLNLISKINRAEQKLIQSLGREPDSNEIAEEIGLSVAKVNAIRCMARQSISLQSPLGSQDENFSLEDTLKDNSENSDFTDFDKDVTYKTLYKLLSTLNRREQEIIVLRFGLFGHKPTPFTELSERFNLTRERVRQLELKIINKLRAPDKIKLLDYYFSTPKQKR